jgi:hypothetical protein
MSGDCFRNSRVDHCGVDLLQHFPHPLSRVGSYRTELVGLLGFLVAILGEVVRIQSKWSQVIYRSKVVPTDLLNPLSCVMWTERVLGSEPMQVPREGMRGSKIRYSLQSKAFRVLVSTMWAVRPLCQYLVKKTSKEVGNALYRFRVSAVVSHISTLFIGRWNPSDASWHSLKVVYVNV